MNLPILSAAAALATVAFAGAALACPDSSQYGTTYSLTGSDIYARQSFGVTAGGSESLTDCGFVETGYVTSNPDFSFNLSQMRGYRIEVRVISQCDAVLLVNSANGTWYYDDDRNGNSDPAVFLDNPGSGYLDVWVGTYNGASCGATVSLETF